MGLAYYCVSPQVLEELHPQILAHEAEPVGPRARGYWFDCPDDYDYEGVQATARQLDETGQANASERLELSEVQAHALSLLDVELPSDGADFPPSLFATSVDPVKLRRYMRIAQRRLGSTPEEALAQIAPRDDDPRFAGYLQKQLRHLTEALPLVWRFHERALEGNQAVLVVDLRARDLEIPDAAELVSMSEG